MLPMILQCSKAPGSQPGQKVSQNIHELFRSCESPTACLPGSCKARKPILSFWSKVRIHWRRYKETTRWRCIRVLCLQPAIHVALHTWARTRSPMRRIPAYLLWQSSVCICIPFSSMLEGTDSFHSQTLTGENIPTVGLFVFSLSIWLQPFPVEPAKEKPLLTLLSDQTFMHDPVAFLDMVLIPQSWRVL